MTDLAERINTLLNEEKRAYEANGRSRGGLGSFNITIQDDWATEGKMPKLIQEKSDPSAIQSKHAALLLKLYAAINPKQKKEMRVHLLGQLSKRSQYFDVSYLIFFVLYKMGLVADAIKTLA